MLSGLRWHDRVLDVLEVVGLDRPVCPRASRSTLLDDFGHTTGRRDGHHLCYKTGGFQKNPLNLEPVDGNLALLKYMVAIVSTPRGRTPAQQATAGAPGAGRTELGMAAQPASTADVEALGAQVAALVQSVASMSEGQVGGSSHHHAQSTPCTTHQ